MRYRSSAGKTSRHTKTDYRQDWSAGKNGMGIAPPMSGIDFVDREPADPGPLRVNPPALIQAKSKIGSPGEIAATTGAQKQNDTGLPDKLKAGTSSAPPSAASSLSVRVLTAAARASDPVSRDRSNVNR